MEVLPGQRVYWNDPQCFHPSWGDVLEVNRENALMLMEDSGMKVIRPLKELSFRPLREYEVETEEKQTHVGTHKVMAACAEEAISRVRAGDGVEVDDEFISVNSTSLLSCKRTDGKEEEDEGEDGERSEE